MKLLEYVIPISAIPFPNSRTEFSANRKLLSHEIRVQLFLRPVDGEEEVPPDERILLCFPFARLPSFFVRARQEMLPHLRLRKDRMPTHAVNETLQLIHAVLDEFFFVTT